MKPMFRNTCLVCNGMLAKQRRLKFFIQSKAEGGSTSVFNTIIFIQKLIEIDFSPNESL